MKLKKSLTSVVLTLVCLMTVHPSNAPAAPGKLTGQPGKQKVVKVYFYHDPGEYIDLSPVERKVSAASPARAALEALLNGPTAREERKGFSSLAGAGEFGIGSLKIVDGIATVNFVATRKWYGWAGDLAPIRFKTAVELTLKQFPNVKSVIVSLNGDTKFADPD